MINALFSYLKNPADCVMQKPKVSNLISLYFITLLLCIPFGVLALLVTKNLHLEDSLKIEIANSPFKMLLIGVLAAPILEEILFRSWFRFSKNNFILLISTLSLLIIFYAFESTITALIISAFVLAFVFLSTWRFSRKSIERFIYSRFKYFFYASAVVFGLLHAFNYSGNIYTLLLFSFILGGRQLIMGLVLGFIRMNYGLLYNIIFHMIINAIVLLTTMGK